MANVLASIIWLVIFFIFSFFIAYICCPWYIFFYTLAQCFPAFEKSNIFLSMANVLGGLLWFLVLITVAFPIAFFCSFWFIVFYCFSQICAGCQDFSDILLKGMQLPGYSVKKIKKCEC